MISEEDILIWQSILIQLEKDKENEIFLGLPEHWYDTQTFCCRNGHIFNSFLKSEKLGRNACFSCYEPVFLCPKFSNIQLHESFKNFNLIKTFEF